MPKITKIEKQKRKGRDNVFIDNEFSFGISEILIVDYNLFVGKEVSEKDIKKYKEGDSKQKCLEKSYRLLTIRPRSEKELRERLIEKFGENTISQTISKLKDFGYINDQDFAKKWVGERKVRKGKKALSYELYRKGIDKNIIEESLSNLSKENELKAAIELVKSKRKFIGLTKDEAYKKVGSFLSSRGFSYDIIKNVIKEITQK